MYDQWMTLNIWDLQNFACFMISQMSDKMCKETKHSGDVCDSWKIDNGYVLVTAYYS